MPRAGTGRSTRREFRPDTEIPGTGRRRRARAVRGQAGRWPLVFPREGGGPEWLDPSYPTLDPRLRGGTGTGWTSPTPRSPHTPDAHRAHRTASTLPRHGGP